MNTLELPKVRTSMDTSQKFALWIVVPLSLGMFKLLNYILLKIFTDPDLNSSINRIYAFTQGEVYIALMLAGFMISAVTVIILGYKIFTTAID